MPRIIGGVTYQRLCSDVAWRAMVSLSLQVVLDDAAKWALRASTSVPVWSCRAIQCTRWRHPPGPGGVVASNAFAGCGSQHPRHARHALSDMYGSSTRARCQVVKRLTRLWSTPGRLCSAGLAHLWTP